MDWAGIRVDPKTVMGTGIAASTVAVNKTLTVTINGTAVLCRAARDVTVAVGDVVMWQRIGHTLFVTDRLFVAAPAATVDEDTPPPKVEPETVYGTTQLAPVETRSYRGGDWRTDNDAVYQGLYASSSFGNHTGCVFYGSKPRSLAGVTVTSATWRARRLQAGVFAAQSTTLRRVTQKTRPSGAPTLQAGEASGPRLRVDQTDTSISLPTSWVQDLVDGTAGGFAIYESDGSPYVRLAGRSDYSSAFTITVKWKKTT